MVSLVIFKLKKQEPEEIPSLYPAGFIQQAPNTDDLYSEYISHNK